MDEHRSESGVDLTLIDEMLQLTPEQRIDRNDQMLAVVQELRRGFGIPFAPEEHPRRAGSGEG
jgi:hypothetical protein